MKYLVKSCEFDLQDDYDMSKDDRINFDELQIELEDQTVGVWEAEDEDDLIEEITTASGWCIKSIDYEVQLK
jgi:SPX domain protein involved in polyphosphate accumulation